MIKKKIPALKNLSDEEKLILAGELWDEIMTEGSFDLTNEQKKMLDRRIKYAEDHPEDSTPWEVVKERLNKKYNA
jgi:putative addiction module component (TIGR02574 family)